MSTEAAKKLNLFEKAKARSVARGLPAHEEANV
jgi:hypothetical protein